MEQTKLQADASLSASLSRDEIAATIAAVLDGSAPVPEGVSKIDAVAVLLEELPDAPPKDVTRAVASLVVDGHDV